VTEFAEQLAELIHHDGVAADLNEAEFAALRAAAAAARTAGGDLVLVASAAHGRAAGPPAPPPGDPKSVDD